MTKFKRVIEKKVLIYLCLLSYKLSFIRGMLVKITFKRKFGNIFLFLKIINLVLTAGVS